MVDEEKFFQYCSDINLAIWENKTCKDDIEEWINNFNPQKKIDVRKMAIDLLLGFIYYNEAEIRYLCKHAFSEFKRQKMKEEIKKGLSIKDAEQYFTNSVSKINFIGKSGDSTAYIAYIFRQVNGLIQKNFINSIDEISSDANTLIIVDDIVGSGNSVINFHKSLQEARIFEKHPDIKIYYLSLIMTEGGLKKIISIDPDFKLIYSELLSKNYKAFSENTCILADYSTMDREIAKLVCKKIGNFLEGEMYELGFLGSELLIGFHHNIPNNTLPLIWSNKHDWIPLFKRWEKN
ncbi:MAG: hypothetical protein Q7V05_12780 [Methanoregula sp.]|nr:hypothetical protein [Methanoregula sp.]